MTGTNSPPRKGGNRPVLVRYRLVGGPVSVDQRITVFEDGAVKLDERHRSGDPTWLWLGREEVDRLSPALEAIPAKQWSVLPRLALERLKTRMYLFLGMNEWQMSGTHFELKHGRRAIAGDEPKAYSAVAAAVKLLDSVRVHAVRMHPR